jgi:uncharacterized protein (DUF2235 family)
MALYAFDGTWDDKNNNTNVLKFFAAYNVGQPSALNRYIVGVGTHVSFLGRLAGGLFGAGEGKKVDEAYDYLKEAFAKDPIIDIVGFSRGAATALDFANRVYKARLKDGTGAMVRPTIRFLGLWDTVAAFGIASLGFYFSRLNVGHHLTLPKDRIEYCFHAMALDERRTSFIVTRVHNGYEVWFRGAHSDIGGGNGNTGLSDIALRWMYDKAIGAGLPIRPTELTGLHPDPSASIDPDILSKLSFVNLRSVAADDRVHYTVSDRPDHKNPPASCPRETEATEVVAQAIGTDAIHA